MFSRRHTSALSIHPSEVCGSNFCRTCTARADNSFSLSRRAVHVFSPIQITFSIFSIVFRLMNRLFYVRQVVILTRPVSGALVFSCFRVLFYIALQKGNYPQYTFDKGSLYRFSARCHRQSLRVPYCPFPLRCPVCPVLKKVYIKQ